jgi:hypothetical protein
LECDVTSTATRSVLVLSSGIKPASRPDPPGVAPLFLPKPQNYTMYAVLGRGGDERPVPLRLGGQQPDEQFSRLTI